MAKKPSPLLAALPSIPSILRPASRSAAGKSTLQDGILALVPPEDVFKYTRITDQALFYSGENTFAHKILAIEEGPGMKGAAYSIRNIQSSGKITVAAAGKTAGDQGLQTKDYTVKGPVSVMLTTTVTTLGEETASRFIVLTIDESARMTRAIHDHHRRGEALNGILFKRAALQLARKHHNAQGWYFPVDSDPVTGVERVEGIYPVSYHQKLFCQRSGQRCPASQKPNRLPRIYTSTAIEENGPVRGNWPNYGKLIGNRHHCHLKKGQPTYVAIWKVADKQIHLVEVSYVGTHEKAPY